MTKDEALKMAIEVMQAYNNQLPSNSATKAINACKEALEQNESTIKWDELRNRVWDKDLKEKNHG